MRYKIVLVPFPFDDLESVKVRPAICLTTTIGTYKHVVIAFITSQISKATEISDLPLFTTDIDFERTGLKSNSAIRLHRLTTVPESLILRLLGELPLSYQIDLEKKLKNLFQLS